MSQWYYSKNGKAQGPVPESEIGTAIKAGELTHLDLVFQVGGEEWQPVAQVEKFAEFLKPEEPEEESPPSTSQIIDTNNTQSVEPSKAEWVILRKVKNDKGMQYKQLGPFTKEKVLELLDSGEILFTDFGWKKGLESWIPLQKLEPFKAPLPSSAPVETQIYEDGDVDDAKDAGENDMTSLTELIEIEKFQRERTQVMSATQIREHWQDTTVTGMRRDPKPADPSQLWSLEPPTGAQGIELKTQTNVQPQKNSKGTEFEVVSEPSKSKPPPRRKKQRAFTEPGHGSAVPWIAAGVALVLSLAFLYFSFTDSQEEIEDVAQGDSVMQQSQTVAESSPSPQRKVVEPEPEEDDSLTKIKKLQARLEELRSRAQRPEPTRKVAAKKTKKKKENKAKKKVVKTKPKPKPVVKAQPKPKKIVKAKPKPKPKPVVKAKPKPKKVAKKKSGAIPAAVRGSHRDRSYYLQRDRKVLFYSSLEAERLVLELEANFKKIGSNKGKWSTFYSRWNRSAKNFLHPLLKRFPQRSQKYAFPKQFSNFRRDHDNLIEYGQFYNGKALGRKPASLGKDMKKIFAKYQEQARNLGRR